MSVFLGGLLIAAGVVLAMCGVEESESNARARYFVVGAAALLFGFGLV